MHWLLERQDAIERKLAARHLKPGGLVLYDLSSSYFEGKCSPLAALGKDRDGKKGKLQVNYGLLHRSARLPCCDLGLQWGHRRRDDVPTAGAQIARCVWARADGSGRRPRDDLWRLNFRRVTRGGLRLDHGIEERADPYPYR